MTKMDACVRGILIGGSLGVLAGVAGLIDPYRGAFLGGLVGILAGVTMSEKRSAREGENGRTAEEDNGK